MCELQFISEGVVLYVMSGQGLDTSMYLLEVREE